MYQHQFPQAGFKLLEQFSQSYANLMWCMMEQNVKQSELVQERLNESVKMIWPWIPVELSPTPVQSEEKVNKELAELRQQVEILNQKIARLENMARSSTWNRSGSGHFRQTV